MVDCHAHNVDVMGSIPISATKFKSDRVAEGEGLLSPSGNCTTGSNPVS